MSKTIVSRLNVVSAFQSKQFWGDNPEEFGKVNEEVVKLHTQYDQGLIDDPEITAFHQATPCGNAEFHISNPDAMGFLKPGLDYYVELKLVPRDKQQNIAAYDHYFPEKSED